MNLQKTTALFLILGSLLFLVTSFSTNPRVYTEPSAEARLSVIMQAPIPWALYQVFYASGALVTAFSAAGVLFSLQSISSLTRFMAALTLIGGAFFFAQYAYFRASDPQSWVLVPPPHPLFLVYTLLTQAGLLIFGFALLQSQTAPRLGWFILGGALSLFVLTLIFRDIPPLAYYLLTLSAGVAFIRRARAANHGLPRAARL